MENMFPLPQGGAQKRPGTKYVAESKSNTKIRVVPFEYSTEQTYIIEFGNQYMRFFTDNAPVLAGDGIEDLSGFVDLLAQWRLNDTVGTTVIDSDGETYNGTGSADASILHADGHVGTGCFDLDSQYLVTIADDDNFSFDDAGDNPFSIACWAYVAEPTGLQVLVSKWDETTGAEDREWRLSLTLDRKLQFHICDDGIDLSANTVAQWKLNENAANTTVLDATANNHDGTTQAGNTSAVSTTGKISTCFDFGGAEYVVITSDNPNLSFGNGEKLYAIT